MYIRISIWLDYDYGRNGNVIKVCDNFCISVNIDVLLLYYLGVIK